SLFAPAVLRAAVMAPDRAFPDRALIVQWGRGVAKSLLGSFVGKNLLFHLAAILVTYLFAQYGFHRPLSGLAARRSLVIDISDGPRVAGAVLPVLLPVALFVFGRLT